MENLVNFWNSIEERDLVWFKKTKSVVKVWCVQHGIAGETSQSGICFGLEGVDGMWDAWWVRPVPNDHK